MEVNKLTEAKEGLGRAIVGRFAVRMFAAFGMVFAVAPGATCHARAAVVSITF